MSKSKWKNVQKNSATILRSSGRNRYYVRAVQLDYTVVGAALTGRPISLDCFEFEFWYVHDFHSRLRNII